ncbi:MAG: metalloregulator ArsR/SmtB family transcription factor [Actinomycetota bacterium]
MNQFDEGLDSVFAALGNAHRRRIVDLLSLQPASIQQIAQQIEMSLTAINRHINVLEEAGLVIRRKAGRVNFLSISRSTMRRVQDWAFQYNAMWATDDETLENLSTRDDYPRQSDGTLAAPTPNNQGERSRKIDEEVPVPLQGLHDADTRDRSARRGWIGSRASVTRWSTAATP